VELTNDVGAKVLELRDVLLIVKFFMLANNEQNLLSRGRMRNRYSGELNIQCSSRVHLRTRIVEALQRRITSEMQHVPRGCDNRMWCIGMDRDGIDKEY